jgi:hypothetical protein
LLELSFLDIIYPIVQDIIENIKSEYDYLHEIPLNGWLWEFIRRNGEYRKIYKDLKNNISEEDLKKLKEVQLSWTEKQIIPQTIANKLNLLENRYGIYPLPSFHNVQYRADPESYFKKEINGKTYHLYIPNPAKKYCDMKIKPRIKGASPVLSYQFKKEYLEELAKGNEDNFSKHCYKAIRRISPAFDIPNTLYLGIALNAKKEDLRKHFEEIIDRHIKSVDTKDRQEKWFYYIIVYDLVEKLHIPYRKVAEILQQAFPDIKKKDNKSLFDEKTISNWSARAHELILDNFRNYMYVK